MASPPATADPDSPLPATVEAATAGLAEGVELDAETTADPGPGLAGDIALCLSGGGYRAAAFHLGVLDLLERAGLLGRVRTLSTISGGTIVGAAWALSRARRESFGDFYGRAWKTLLSLNVVREAAARLARGDGGAGASLIRAAARVYAGSELLGEARLGELMDNAEGPDEAIFSATEFHSGRAYRFQTSRRSRVRVGNLPPLQIPTEVAREIRLADVVAASSCFPGAFEPLVFPRDFAWADAAAVARALGSRFPPVPLMDGGIYDNQGVDGAVTVYQRGAMFEQLGLLLVSDTSQRQEPLYVEAPPSPLPRVRVRTLRRLAAVGRWLALVSFLALLYRLLAAPWTPLSAALGQLFTGVVPAALAGASALGLWWGRRLFRRQAEATRETTGVELGPLVAHLRLGDLVDLLTRRLGSLLAMVGSVSMKRVRRLIQDSVLAESSPFRPRTQLLLLYGLDRKRPTLWARHPDLQPAPALQLLARRAEAVPTTLWIDDEEQLRDLVACGQATACSRLLQHVRDHRAAALADPESVEAKVEATLRPLWAALQDNPFALLRRAPLPALARAARAPAATVSGGAPPRIEG